MQQTCQRARGINGGGFAAADTPPWSHRGRLRGRPSGLKGRYRDRYATGLRPALDPGASTAPHAQWHGAGAAAPAHRRAAALHGSPFKQIPTNKVSTVSGDCHTTKPTTSNGWDNNTTGRVEPVSSSAMPNDANAASSAGAAPLLIWGHRATKSW